MEFVPLDESLINSDTCIRCGHCCKWTTSTQLGDDTRLDWLTTLVEDNELVSLVNHNQVSVNGNTKNPFEVKITCSKLIVDEQEGTYKCGVYLDRPKVCSDYNCFSWANNLKRRPQNWERIKRIIKEVHGVDVEWSGPLNSKVYKKNIENLIKTKEIK